MIYEFFVTLCGVAGVVIIYLCGKHAIKAEEQE